MDEGALVQQAIAGDREAFAGLVRLHQARLRAFTALSIAERADVHDIVQEAFIDAWRGLPGFDATRPFGPWLRTICRNRSAKFLRDRLPHRRRELALVDAALLEGPVPTEEAQCDQRLTALRACLETLDDAHRQLLRRRYHDEVAVQDIAAALGKSPNGVSMMLLRLKSVLMKCVDGRMVGHDGPHGALP
jgi:RNA polymerase sigma-70 factor (ECF subfamily)